MVVDLDKTVQYRLVKVVRDGNSILCYKLKISHGSRSRRNAQIQNKITMRHSSYMLEAQHFVFVVARDKMLKSRLVKGARGKGLGV